MNQNRVKKRIYDLILGERVCCEIMINQDILQYGHPQLCTPTEYIIEWDKYIHKHAQKVSYILNKTENGVAVAANQVLGGSYRFFVYKDQRNQHRVVINPEIKFGEKLTIDVEGCLSFPETFALVGRYSFLQVNYVSFPEFEEVTVDIHDDSFLARVFQHEIEHLDGKLFIDNLSLDRKNEFMDRFYAKIQKKRV